MHRSLAHTPRAATFRRGPATISFCLLALLQLGAAYAECPGTFVNGGTGAAFVEQRSNTASNASQPLDMFIGTGCSTMKFGPMQPSQCIVDGNPMVIILGAIWGGPANNTVNNGCTFTCENGQGTRTSVCRVRGGDGLPVELMDFSIGGPAPEGPGEGADSEVSG